MKYEIEECDIVDGLDGLGVRPTCFVMAHASLSKFGRVAGGAPTVVEAIRKAVGVSGAAIMPSFRDAIRSSNYGLNDCSSDCPQLLCTSNERGYAGIIAETLRQQSDSLRSCHPTHSWVGIGAGASFLLEGHRLSPTPCGRDSPFFRLLERNGFLVLLGVGVNSITNLHAIEDVRNVPYLSAFDSKRRHATYTTSGRRLQYKFPELLQSALVECGLLRTTQIGLANCHAIAARDLGAFLWLVTEDDPWCLVLRPRGHLYDPGSDAAQKATRMVEVWKNRPDRSAWQQLVEASRREFSPNSFFPTEHPAMSCPAYRGTVRGHHRCAANDLPPWEQFEDYDCDEPGVATCGSCNWAAWFANLPV
jgi:aminoglycoside N3'-acetyltransferase